MINVIIVCAEWCGVCRDYRASLAGELNDSITWIDLDDFESLPNAPSIDTFPTVVVLNQADVLFAGALDNRQESLLRLLSAVAQHAPKPEYEALGRELCAWLVKRPF
jgi:hypothetical protein